MRQLFPAASLAVLASLLASCAKAPEPVPQIAPLGYSAPVRLQPDAPDIMMFPGPRKGLAGRTLQVGSLQDIVLMRNEVILTFDDGPVPGRTKRILDALDRHNVKATFLMVGQMARSYPQLVREVATRGHAVGSHTQNHSNLAAVGFERAMEDIRQGERSVADALVPARALAAPFFRFPYLSDTPALRAHLAGRGVVVIDVDIDSKDYFQSTPAQVRQRTLDRLAGRGSGIILFHDLHERTAAMLPGFLDDLHARGYKVVHIVPKGRSRDEVQVATAQ